MVSLTGFTPVRYFNFKYLYPRYSVYNFATVTYKIAKKIENSKKVLICTADISAVILSNIVLKGIAALVKI